MRLLNIAGQATLVLSAIVFVWLTGCGHKDCDTCHTTAGAKEGNLPGTKKESEEEAEIGANRAKLSPDDRRLVEAQEFCAIMEDSRLGSMGLPIKVVLKDKDGKEQPLFVCCKGCVKKAQRNPDQTLAKVEQLKTKAKESPPSK